MGDAVTRARHRPARPSRRMADTLGSRPRSPSATGSCKRRSAPSTPFSSRPGSPPQAALEAAGEALGADGSPWASGAPLARREAPTLRQRSGCRPCATPPPSRPPPRRSPSATSGSRGQGAGACRVRATPRRSDDTAARLEVLVQAIEAGAYARGGDRHGRDRARATARRSGPGERTLGPPWPRRARAAGLRRRSGQHSRESTVEPGSRPTAPATTSPPAGCARSRPTRPARRGSPTTPWSRRHCASKKRPRRRCGPPSRRSRRRAPAPECCSAPGGPGERSPRHTPSGEPGAGAREAEQHGASARAAMPSGAMARARLAQLMAEAERLQAERAGSMRPSPPPRHCREAWPAFAHGRTALEARSRRPRPGVRFARTPGHKERSLAEAASERLKPKRKPRRWPPRRAGETNRDPRSPGGAPASDGAGRGLGDDLMAARRHCHGPLAGQAERENGPRLPPARRCHGARPLCQRRSGSEAAARPGRRGGRRGDGGDSMEPRPGPAAVTGMAAWRWDGFVRGIEADDPIRRKLAHAADAASAGRQDTLAQVHARLDAEARRPAPSFMKPRRHMRALGERAALLPRSTARALAIEAAREQAERRAAERQRIEAALDGGERAGPARDGPGNIDAAIAEEDVTGSRARSRSPKAWPRPKGGRLSFGRIAGAERVLERPRRACEAEPPSGGRRGKRCGPLSSKRRAASELRKCIAQRRRARSCERPWKRGSRRISKRSTVIAADGEALAAARRARQPPGTAREARPRPSTPRQGRGVEAELPVRGPAPGTVEELDHLLPQERRRQEHAGGNPVGTLEAETSGRPPSSRCGGDDLARELAWPRRHRPSRRQRWRRPRRRWRPARPTPPGRARPRPGARACSLAKPSWIARSNAARAGARDHKAPRQPNERCSRPWRMPDRQARTSRRMRSKPGSTGEGEPRKRLGDVNLRDPSNARSFRQRTRG